MTLERYRRKRDFRRTGEPRGKRAAAKGRLFVIQKHAARALHYDFRLQIGDVLASWAVPKGPSLDPDVRRLAMHVEDHPVEYGAFEGTIPQGQYGAGTVMLWDRGTWEIDGDPSDEFRQGKLHFTLHGEKLRGEWVLVRRGGQGRDSDGKDPWFLFKIRDHEAREGDDDGILRQDPDSVASGRTLDEIAAGKKRGKRRRRSKPQASDATARSAPRAAPPRRGEPQVRKKLLGQLPNAKQAPLPESIRPQLATLAKRAPTGDSWLGEIKFDGYRMICRVDRRNVAFFSRNQLDWTARFDHLVKAVRGLGCGSAVFDGEVVALDPEGASSFPALQNALAENRTGQLVYYMFDLLYLDGTSLMKVPLEDRKLLLAKVLGDDKGPLRYSEHVVGNAPELFSEAASMGLEGIICKRRDRPYRAGRSTEWLKVKCSERAEFVVGGFTPPQGARIGFGALVLGYYDKHKKLIYAGRVGTGFDDRTLEELASRLTALERKESPFANPQGRPGTARGVRWVKPRLVAQVQFSGWTREGYVWHPSFQGLREDKAAREVIREQPLPAKAVAEASASANKLPAGASRRSDRSPIAKIPASLRLTNPDKVLYPGDEITKADLAGYYALVADLMLPHVINRPMVLVRGPQGYTGHCFYQKHAGQGMPEVLGRVTITEKRKKIEYVVVEDLEGLLSLVQMNALEMHVWGSRTDKVDRPDRLVFDLDPDPSVRWERVIESARQLRSFFQALGLTTFPKTSGGKGLHLVLPIERRTDWQEARSICQAIAQAAAEADPGRYTINMSKAAREGKIFIDYLRNVRGATCAAAYSTRARAGAPVSTPISWEELPRVKAGDQFTVQNMPQRLARLKRDPWGDLAETKQVLSKSLLKKLGNL